ncbi:MAG: hypothetical protein Q8P60_05910, partial [Pseudorhodobacter sp.]|nr:hypothetical protein [Pseudorhodobacter sp.]
VRHCFPEINRWLDGLTDSRRQAMCVYSGRHIWWQIMLTFILRGGSRNAFDGDRNSGELPENLMRLCDQAWDEERLGPRRTVTCSENAKHHAERVPVEEVAQIPLKMVRRLMSMRMLDRARLFDRWWLIAIDGTLQDRGHDTSVDEARYRYVVEAKLVGPDGTMFPLMTEFEDMRDPVRDKEDCELNAFRRLAVRLQAEFPKLSICLLIDGLYPVQSVFDLCDLYAWKFIGTLREGRQPTAWDEAVQTMMMSPANVFQSRRQGENGSVEQTLRWTDNVPFGTYEFSVLFSGEISPADATLWCWVTNLCLSREKVYAIANQGGRARNGIENVFNVEKNGGFGLEHAFCANTVASQNYHIMMQVAYILWQLLANGLLRRLMRACRKVTVLKMVELLRASLLSVRINPLIPSFGQLRFRSSA